MVTYVIRPKSKKYLTKEPWNGYSIAQMMVRKCGQTKYHYKDGHCTLNLINSLSQTASWAAVADKAPKGPFIPRRTPNARARAAAS